MMWSAWGSAATIWVSESGGLSFGGEAEGHEFRPLADQFNERGEHSESDRVSKLPLTWSFFPRSSGYADDFLSNCTPLVGDFRRPDRVGGIFVIYKDLVGFTGILDDAAFQTAYDAFKVFIMSAGSRQYVLSSDFVGGRHSQSDSQVPTTNEFYRLGHPYIVEEGPKLAFKFGSSELASP